MAPPAAPPPCRQRVRQRGGLRRLCHGALHRVRRHAGRRQPGVLLPGEPFNGVGVHWGCHEGCRRRAAAVDSVCMRRALLVHNCPCGTAPAASLRAEGGRGLDLGEGHQRHPAAHRWQAAGLSREQRRDAEPPHASDCSRCQCCNGSTTFKSSLLLLGCAVLPNTHWRYPACGANREAGDVTGGGDVAGGGGGGSAHLHSSALQLCRCRLQNSRAMPPFDEGLPAGGPCSEAAAGLRETILEAMRDIAASPGWDRDRRGAIAPSVCMPTPPPAAAAAACKPHAQQDRSPLSSTTGPASS